MNPQRKGKKIDHSPKFEILSIEQMSQSLSQKLRVPDTSCLIIKKNANVKKTLDRLLQILIGGDDSIVLTAQNENIQKMFTILEIIKQKALQNENNSDTIIGDSNVTLEFVEYHQYNKLDYLRVLKPNRAPSTDYKSVDNDASRRSEIMNNPLTKQDKELLEVEKPISVPILTVYVKFARSGSSISQDQGLIMNGWSFQKSK